MAQQQQQQHGRMHVACLAACRPLAAVVAPAPPTIPLRVIYLRDFSKPATQKTAVLPSLLHQLLQGTCRQASLMLPHLLLLLLLLRTIPR